MRNFLSILLLVGSLFIESPTLLAQTIPGDTTLVSSDDVIKSIGEKFEAPDVTQILSFSKILWALVFIVIGYFTVRFLSRTIEIWSEKSPERRVKGKAIVPIVKIICWMVIAYFIVKGIFNPPIESLIAFGASVGVAVGFAAQDILKNIFGGFVIIIDRPFKVGDKIEVGSTYGEVLDMSLRSTRVHTADDSIVTLPNGDLMNQAISNSNSGETNCQVVAEIYLPITIDTHQVRKIAMEVAKLSNFVYLAKPIAVIFVNEIKYDKLCYKMRLKAYVMDIRFEFAFKSELSEKVIKELLAANILSSENSI
jgi:small-conductance mechanosensitive channel